jgi:hypothetical protein
MTQQGPDAFRGLVKDDELVVEFGQLGAEGVEGTTRLVLPVETARRLATRLGDALARFAPESLVEDAPVRGTTPVNAPPDPAGERAALTLRLVAGLGAPRNHERSFRIAPGALMANRILLTLDPRDIPGDARARVLDVCDRLAMPAAARAEAGELFAQAACIHFGFEEGAGRMLSKLYLEFAPEAHVQRRAREQGEPVLLHHAFKWQPGEDQAVVSRYLLYPGLDADAIGRRLAAIYDAASAAASLDIATSVLQLAAARVPGGALQYLEVTEPGNARRSFDLNCYDAGLQLKDVQPALFAMRDRFDVRPGQFQALYDQVRDSRFGHLAGGVHRDGADFFNIYYGVSGYPRVVGGLA